MKIDKIWLTDTAVWVHSDDGREASERFADYPRLQNATPKQRAAYTITPDGIHWEALDEDLSFEGFFRQKSSSPLYIFFMQHPELNASAIARRLGISQSLFAQYISGSKRPSGQRLNAIRKIIQLIGQELTAVSF